jgi:FkbM family methyltransferase
VLTDRLARFARRPAAEKRRTIRFFARRALSKVPYIPIRTGLTVAPGESLPFWWSCLPMADHVDRTLWEYWGDDRGELRFLWQFLGPGMVFFDIGAYHGIFSLVAAKRLGAQGQIVAFEPSRRERRRFELHMRWNGIDGVHLEPYAVSSSCEALKFFTVASGFTTMNSLRRPPIEDPVCEMTVEAVSLDHYLEDHKITQIDLLKIDVEGGEIEAFRGARLALQAVRPVVICELLDWVARAWGNNARDALKVLQQHEYEWFEFRDDGTIRRHETRDEYPDAQNYLAVPREKLGLVEGWRRDRR